MATEEGESSSKVVVLRTETVIKRVKDKDRDITLNNNITLNWLVKVITPPKFNSDLSKLKEYLKKVQIYINYTLDRFTKEY
jgi:hypothetical protein